MGHSKIPLHRLKALAASEGAWLSLGLLLRLYFAWHLGGRLYQADETGYLASAQSLSDFGVFGFEGTPRVGIPGAPAFFAAALGLGGGVPLARVFSAVLSTATAWLIGRLTRAASGSERAGLIALAVSCLYPFFVYYSGLLMSETAYLFLVVGALWAGLKAAEKNGRDIALCCAAGFLWALAGLTRTEGVPIALFLWLACALACALGRFSWRGWALAVFVWAVPLWGWGARNAPLAGRWTLDTHGGMTMLHGSMFYDVDQMDTAYSQQAIDLELAARGELAALNEGDKDAYLMKMAVDWMKENPGTVLRQWTQKAVAFWRFYPRIDKAYPDTATANPNAGLSRTGMTFISLLFEPALILGGFYGLWLSRRKFFALFPLYWFVLATFGVHVVVVSQMRYRLPVMPVLILFAAWAVEKSLPRLKTRTRA